MRKGDCPFCGAVNVEIDIEDACPKWILRSIERLRRSERVRIQTFGKANRDYPSYSGAIPVHAPCKKNCNGGWMSRLESRAKPLLRPMIEPASPIAIPLGFQSRAEIAFWLLKTAMVWDFVSPNSPFFTNEERQRATRHELPSHLDVWAGRYTGPGLLHQSHNPLRLMSIEARGAKPVEITAHGFTFTAGHLTLQLLYIRPRKGVLFKGMLSHLNPRDHLIPLWPTETQVVWPPNSPIDSFESLNTISSRWGTFRPDDPRAKGPS